MKLIPSGGRRSITLPRGCSQWSLSVTAFLGGGGKKKKKSWEADKFFTPLLSQQQSDGGPTDKSGICCSEVSGEVSPCSASPALANTHASLVTRHLSQHWRLGPTPLSSISNQQFQIIVSTTRWSRFCLQTAEDRTNVDEPHQNKGPSSRSGRRAALVGL